MSVLKSLANGVSVGVLVTGLSLTVGVVAITTMASPAYAQTTLSAAQIAAIESSLQSALNSALTDETKAAAVAQAITTAIALYGSDNAAAITSAVMNKAERAGVSPSAIGTGLAQASATLAQGHNLAAANAIATAVANEGNAGERAAYQTAATGLGYTNLASIAGGGPTITGGTGGQGGIGAGGTGGNFTGGGTGDGGCLNPSCTHL